ncbi:hypothetical protein EYF80_034150 [Liparis tanakae]|uniref:Uncharacterized protein n=1 Tax=Liparis tanakae TaxID=230148 RepID=A0A4Z2GSP7_9TELE|nr:hypothetical protein EYF80_034150 [Liparis tanakae]
MNSQRSMMWFRQIAQLSTTMSQAHSATAFHWWDQIHKQHYGAITAGFEVLGFEGLAFTPGVFERLVLGFLNFGDLEDVTTFLSGGELLSGQAVNTWTSLTF